MKKILYLGGASGRNEFFCKLSQHLGRKFKSAFIATDSGGKRFFKNAGVRSYEVFSHRGVKNLDIKKVRTFEKKYSLNVWFAWSVSFPRGNAWKVRRDEVLSYSQYVIEDFEKVLEKEKPDYFLCFGPAGYHHVLMYQMCEAKGIKIIELPHGTLDERFSIRADLHDTRPLLEKRYEEKTNLSESEKKEAEKLLNRMLEEKKQVLVHDKVKESWSQFGKRFCKWAWRNIRGLRIPPEVKLVKYRLKERYFKARGLFERPVKGEKFVFFPLHVQPEVATLIYGRWFVDQVALIENIAKALPADHYLYVKEHPKRMGARPLWYHKRIARLPNVRLLGQKEKTLDLIEQCSFVATITGTAGFEALLRQKPVLVFGDVFYMTSANVFKVRCPKDIPRFVNEALSFKPPKEEVLRFLSAMKDATYPGWTLLNGPLNKRTFKPENMKKLAEGVLAYMREMCGEKV